MFEYNIMYVCFFEPSGQCCLRVVHVARYVFLFSHKTLFIILLDDGVSHRIGFINWLTRADIHLRTGIPTELRVEETGLLATNRFLKC